MAINFTKDQQQVIDHNAGNLLVFASAGSGKTAVIIEKIALDIIEGRTSLDNLLVVTFTEAATAEMKQRLYDKLSQNIDKPNVINEIEKLPLANISTLHGYCQKIIKQYFFDIGIDPSFGILDEAESNFFKIKALDDVIRAYEERDDKEFLELCEKFYSNRTLNELKKSVLDFYDFLQALDDKDEYLDNVALSSYNTDINKNPACIYLKNKFEKDYLYFKGAFNRLKTCSDMEGSEKLSKALDTICSYFSGESFSNFTKLFDYFKALDGVNSPLKSLRDKSDTLEKARGEWKAFSAMIDDFFDTCGGDVSIDDIKSALSIAKASIVKFIELTQAFEKEYSAIKIAKNALDFDDLEKYALNLLSNQKISSVIKEQFSSVYVDEYQDINSKQEKILSLISNGDNMIMVGDIKQSIYGFRNSTPQIFINKSKEYKNDNGGSLIKLNENFRSNPVILNFVNKIFGNVMVDDFGGVDYEKDGKFIGSASYEKVSDYKEVSIDIIDTKDRPQKEAVDSKVYSVVEDDRKALDMSPAYLEALTIANKIKNMKSKPYYDAKEKVFKTLDFNNFNILCRGREYIKELSIHLSALGVPVSAKTSSNIYKNPDILFIVNIVKVINNPKDDIALTSILSSPFFGITLDELLENRVLTDDKFFYEAVDKWRNSDTPFGKKLNVVFDFISNLREQKDFKTIYDLLIDADRSLSFSNYYLLLPGGRERYKLITDFIESFNDAPYNSDITEYLTYVDSYLKDTEVPVSVTSDENCVGIDTIHSSKGLEYEVVFVCGCGKRFSSMSLMQKVLKNKELGVGFNAFDTDAFAMRQTIAKNAIAMKITEEEKLEEVRLLYVALTRAKNSLNILACVDTDKLYSPSAYDLRKSNKYISWITSAFSPALIENIRTCENSKTFNNNDEYEVNIVKPLDIIGTFEKATFEKTKLFEDEAIVRDIENYIDSQYEHKDSFLIAQKNTVTGIMNMQSEAGESYNLEPKKLETKEHSMFDFDYARLGSIYHKLMQDLNFDSDKESIRKYISSEIEKNPSDKKYYDKVNIDKVYTCLSTLLPIVKDKEIYKEKQFISYIPYNDVADSSIKDRVLLQGVIDLMVESDEGVDIYDYKTTKVDNAEQLVAKYMVQMKLYKLATERAVGKQVKNVYIYSFCLDKIIKII